MSRVTVHVNALEFARACDICGDSLAGYFPNCDRCDNCTDEHGPEFEPIESESLHDCLADIGGGLSQAPWY